MPTITKIKIIDDTMLRNELDMLYDIATQQDMVNFSLLLCFAIMKDFTYNIATTNLINQAITINKRWLKEEASVSEVRMAALNIHKKAKLSQNTLEIISLRCIAQALSCAHMKEHAMVASDYMIKLYNELNYDLIQISSKREWQIRILKEILNNRNTLSLD